MTSFPVGTEKRFPAFFRLTSVPATGRVEGSQPTHGWIAPAAWGGGVLFGGLRFWILIRTALDLVKGSGEMARGSIVVGDTGLKLRLQVHE